MTLYSFATTITFALWLSLLPSNSEAGEARQSNRELTSQPWESGQRMFYTDSLWRGGDCASSIDLGGGRVLWLFADSFVGIKPPYVRDLCCVAMIRNCMGIQTGYDPSTADFNVYWRGTGEFPSAYFPSDDTSWYWPGNAVKIDSCLVIFLMHVCPSDSGLSFRSCGSLPHSVYIASGLDGTPLEWTLRPLTLPENQYGIMLGAATIVEPPYLYMLSVKEPVDHSMYLARWPIDDVIKGKSTAIEWWAGNASPWVPDTELASEPDVIFPKGATELSIVYDDETGQFFTIQTVGFGAADIMMRTAPALTGPWSDLQLLYEPPEKSDSEIMIYAAKAHTWITDADLAITYNTNAPVERIIADTTIYYPRLVKLDWIE